MLQIGSSITSKSVHCSSDWFFFTLAFVSFFCSNWPNTNTGCFLKIAWSISKTATNSLHKFVRQTPSFKLIRILLLLPSRGTIYWKYSFLVGVWQQQINCIRQMPNVSCTLSLTKRCKRKKCSYLPKWFHKRLWITDPWSVLTGLTCIKVCALATVQCGPPFWISRQDNVRTVLQQNQ